MESKWGWNGVWPVNSIALLDALTVQTVILVLRHLIITVRGLIIVLEGETIATSSVFSSSWLWTWFLSLSGASTSFYFIEINSKTCHLLWSLCWWVWLVFYLFQSLDWLVSMSILLQWVEQQMNRSLESLVVFIIPSVEAAVTIFVSFSADLAIQGMNLEVFAVSLIKD